MDAAASVKTSPDFPIPEKMKAWVLGNPGELKLAEKSVPIPQSRRGSGPHRCSGDLRD